MINFQIHSREVLSVYNNDRNILIEDGECPDGPVIIYFTSHDLYYPNNSVSFHKSVIIGNRYEWRNLKIPGASKHIFVRDVFKQWYLRGINAHTNTLDKLCELLKGYIDKSEVITIGSSAGGSMAVYFGALLNAKKTIAFSPQIDLTKLIRTEYGKTHNPIVVQMSSSLPDILSHIATSACNFMVFFPAKRNSYDENQLESINQYFKSGLPPNFNLLLFDTSHHGIPFPKAALKSVLNPGWIPKNKYISKISNPILFSIEEAGFIKTINGMASQLFKVGKKVLIRKFHSKS